jgi:hypothetical protein
MGLIHISNKIPVEDLTPKEAIKRIILLYEELKRIPNLGQKIQYKTLRKRIKRIEKYLRIDKDQVETIKALSKGVFKGTADLMNELAEIKHDLVTLTERFEKLLKVLSK